MQQSFERGYEKQDVNVSKVIAYTIIVMVVLAGIIVAVTEYFNYYERQLRYDMVLNKPSPALIELRAKEEKILNSYDLIDYSKGIYRIPIERAMRLIADEAYKKNQNKK